MQFVAFEKCPLYQIAREIMLLLVNNVYENKSESPDRYFDSACAICNLYSC